MTYLGHFIIRIVLAAYSLFKNLFFYFGKHDPLCKVFTLSFVMTGYLLLFALLLRLIRFSLIYSIILENMTPFAIFLLSLF